MNPNSIVIILAVVLLPAILVYFVITRLNRNRWRHVQEMEGKESEFESDLHQGIEGQAIVTSKSETIAPNAGGYAKVDLQVEVQLPGKAPYQVSTCWLVKMDSLDQVSPGHYLSIKVNPKKTTRVFPNVPWAKLWIFG